MGTRADFYMKNENTVLWLGSIGWDGYPDGMDASLLEARTDEEYLNAFQKYINPRKDFTSPDQGWPWPWQNSNTTDYAYMFEGDRVLASCFGGDWFLAMDKDEKSIGSKPDFPDMTALMNVRFDSGSGLIIVG